MTNRSIIILMGIVILLGVLIAVTLLLRSDAPPSPQEPNPEFPQSGAGDNPAPAADEFDIQGVGGVVRAHDIRQDPGTKKDEGSFYRLYDFGPASPNSSFQMVYSDTDFGFLITLNALPLHAARAEAETYLLARLKITESDACKLNVSVAVPAQLDPDLAGRNLGLSFCPGAAALQ